MYINREIINEIEVRIADELLNASWNHVSDTKVELGSDQKLYFTYLKGVHDMAEKLRERYDKVDDELNKLS